MSERFLAYHEATTFYGWGGGESYYSPVTPDGWRTSQVQASLPPTIERNGQINMRTPGHIALIGNEMPEPDPSSYTTR
jgi:hypothetical protein